MWVSSLLGLLPYGITKLIVCEPEKKANDYKHVRKGISATTQKHSIDDWSNLIKPEELAHKLDAYENVQKGTKMRPSPANDGINPRKDSRNFSNRQFAPRMYRQYNIEKCAQYLDAIPFAQLGNEDKNKGTEPKTVLTVSNRKDISRDKDIFSLFQRGPDETSHDDDRELEYHKVLYEEQRQRTNRLNFELCVP
ncbi:hypothetical protein TNCV_3687771 [Trichonephila clavipes]|nr:hypothetical protein TNCV_3687771 [Trichonephila clavipes]